ncbi:MAG TPA: hypothetical protein DCZ95_08480 [Verrucomicrobia bacterium]|nr:MAG: hypothetical protein A2X46_12515 [Lentisphaerae bacterium GWF2_57_35]HBA84114.1 hypothetical protein [Verrucomicrobiota bacterium]
MPERLIRLESARTSPTPKTSRTGFRSDQANTSRLSQMMSRSVKEIGQLTAPRPDKIAAFKGSLDQPVNASAQVTNVIFDHMING